MSRSPLFGALQRVSRLVRFAEARRVTVADAREIEAEAHERRLSRRQILGGLGALAIGAAAWPARARPVRGQPRVAIVGAGMAGLACADQLARRGVRATIYEAHPYRVGGRVFTDRETFAGQVAENGGEFIDTLHLTMLAYAKEFGLAREDLEHAPGESAFFFGGRHFTEDEVVAEYRELVGRMRGDVQSISAGGPTFFEHSEADRTLDFTSLADYLALRGEGLPLIQAVMTQAYVAEYGRETHEQSSLNFLQYIHLDKRRKFAEFGVFSDERWHLAGGNDALAHALADRVGGVQLGARLTKLARNASGEYELFINGGLQPERADAVVLAVPFSVLRTVQLDASLGLSDDKRRAIAQLGYGDNCKTAVRFDRRVWAEQGRSGLAYTDLANVQNTWETNYTRAPGGGILTDYAGGARGRALQAAPPPRQFEFDCTRCHVGAPADAVLTPTGRDTVQDQIEAFVADLDHVFPGAAAAASRRPDGLVVGQRGHWTPQPYSRGSYTCYLPGQFTTLAGLEAQPAGALKFAGEHTDSFYEWQGFMEGACNSGIRAAKEVLEDIKRGRI